MPDDRPDHTWREGRQVGVGRIGHASPEQSERRHVRRGALDLFPEFVGRLVERYDSALFPVREHDWLERRFEIDEVDRHAQSTSRHTYGHLLRFVSVGASTAAISIETSVSFFGADFTVYFLMIAQSM